MPQSGLEIRDLRFRYPFYGSGEDRQTLSGVDLRLDRGRMAAVFAGADAGKSTMARIISGIVPLFTGGSLSGDVSFCGRSVIGPRPYELTETVGSVFQNPDEQLITTRCDTEVSFPLESLGVPRRMMKERVASALDLMGLADYAPRNPATLSGGEKKRLLLACIAAVDPDLWVLDEAFEELDASWKTRLLDFLAARGRTVLFFDSRWSPLYAARCARFAVLHEGRISCAADGSDSAELGSTLAAEGVTLAIPATSLKKAGDIGDAALRAEGISFRFPGPGTFAVEIESFELRRGSVCSLLGRNGSGKSTLGKILCGLISPQKGSISLSKDSSRRRASPEELHAGVGYMFQNPDYQIFLPTVREELALGLGALRARDGSIDHVIELYGLPEGETPPALMSYGARKRLQAATYHLLGRDFLILDETDSGLSYREFLSLLDALSSGGAGILLVTHDAALARAVSHRIFLMEDGRIERDLAPEELNGLEGVGGA